jgi:cyclopropane fatty-acyl-phospholipid synthase-like methyltransferase
MPKIVLDYYKGNDLYSDGAIEDEILLLVEKCNGNQQALEKVVLSDSRWPMLYHLSSERHMLFQPFHFNKDAKLLEVGAGCGALTGFFLQRVAEVTAVELSLKRSRIMEKRFQTSKGNLEIMVGNFFDIPPEPKYEFETLIGVLEYAGLICSASNPAVCMLERAKEWLVSGGKLFVAIENRFGLKYFAGCREDHTGKLFQSIEGYHPESSVATLSKDELSNVLQEAGFAIEEWYYPYPDYKLPSEIFSEKLLPNTNQFLPDVKNFDFERLQLFSEIKAWQGIIKNNMFPFFANSFLVLARAL